MDMSNKYNGYTNYETWVYALHVESAGDMLELAREHNLDVYDLSQVLKAEAEDAIPDDIAPVFLDLLNGAVAEINFRELAQTYIDEAIAEDRLQAA